MRSVYAKISLWSFATLVLSLIAFVGVTWVVSFQASRQTGQFGQIQTMEMEEAREAYESGGPVKLREFIGRLTAIFRAATILPTEPDATY